MATGYGGVLLNQTNVGMRILAFNTISANINHGLTGAASGVLGIDIDGDARPQDGRRDIGADEYTPGR